MRIEKQYLARLLKLMEDKRIIPFIGAGFSKLAGLPSAMELARKISKELEMKYKGETLSEVCSEIVIKHDKFILAEILEKNLEINDTANFENQMLLGQMNWKIAITTNWDEAIEKALPGVSIITTDKSHYFAERKQIDSRLIKLHGDLKDPESLIITEQDMKRQKKENPALHTYLHALFHSKPFLFLGYSLKDADLLELIKITNKIFGELREMSFAVLKMPKNLTVADKEKEKNEWRDKNIIIIDSDVSSFLKFLLSEWQKNKMKYEKECLTYILPSQYSKTEFISLSDHTYINVDDGGNANIIETFHLRKIKPRKKDIENDLIYLAHWDNPEFNGKIDKEKFIIEIDGKSPDVLIPINDRHRVDLLVSSERSLKKGEELKITLRLNIKNLFYLHLLNEYWDTIFNYKTLKGIVEIEIPISYKYKMFYILFLDTWSYVPTEKTSTKLSKNRLLVDFKNPEVGRPYYIGFELERN